MKSLMKEVSFMKRLISWSCLLLFLVSLCACSESTPLEDPPSTDQTATETKAYESNQEEQTQEPEMMGNVTAEDMKGYLNNDLGYAICSFYVRYPDDSFEYYSSGSVIEWGSGEAYTYGTERTCYNLVLHSKIDAKNIENLSNGDLVFLCNQNTRVEANIFPVIESGFAMTSINNDGYLLFKNQDGSSYTFTNGNRKPPEKNISTINGISVGKENIFQKDKSNKYVTLKEGDTYVIGEVNGTQLRETEFEVDSVYYLHTYDTDQFLYEYNGVSYAFRYQPTTDGYAIVDLSELPEGDYVIMYTYWNTEYKSRMQQTIHIRID